MEIKIGAKVRFLNNVGGGRVTKIIDKKMVQVLSTDGFEMPVLISELLVIEEDNIQATNKQELFNPFQNTNKKEEKPVKEEVKEEVFEEEEEEDYDDDYEKPDDDINLYLGFVPKDAKKPLDCDLELYLINDSNYYTFFNRLMPEGNSFKSNTGTIEANVKEPIAVLTRNDVQDLKSITFQLMFFKKDKAHELKPCIEKEVKINPVKFFKNSSFRINDFFEENAFVIPIIEQDGFAELMKNISADEIKKAILDNKKSQKVNSPKQYKKHQDPRLQEIIVDLHITELVESEKGLSARDMLEIQLDTFHKKLAEAIKNKNKKIVFIHGVGNGKLRTEVRKELDRKYKLQYQDASFKEYGYGATMVLLK